MTHPDSVSIAVETALSPDMRALIGELNGVLSSLTSDEANHRLAVEDMADARTTVFVARVNGEAAGCGALYRHPNGIGEVKRMYTRPAFQGLGLGRQILNEVIALAKQEGFDQLVLETGHNYEAAKHLYQSSGFEPCGPVLDYPDHPESVFLPAAPDGCLRDPFMTDLTKLTIADAREGLKNKDYTSLELTEAFLGNIEAANEQLNAYVAR